MIMGQTMGITIERPARRTARYARIDLNKKTEYTPNGNRLYRFRSISKNELEMLRVHTYPYLL
jgi:hypothetical protein